MRHFIHIAKLIKHYRTSHPKNYSQSELSHLLGYKNGQFISNVERGLCNIPYKMLIRVSQILNINVAEIKEAILKDQEMTIDSYLADDFVVEGKILSRRTAKKKDDFGKDQNSGLSSSSNHKSNEEHLAKDYSTLWKKSA